MYGMRDFKPDDEKQLDFIQFMINADISSTISLEQLEMTTNHHLRNIEALSDYGLITYRTLEELRDYIHVVHERASFALKED